MRKLVSIVSSSAVKCIDSFPCPFALENTSGQWSRCTESRTSAFCEFQQHFFRDIVPDSLWTVLFDGVPLLFGTRTNEWPLSNTKFLRKYFDDSGICQAFIFVVFSVTRCHWTLTWIEFFLWKFLVLLPSRSVDHWLYRRSCNVVNPGKIFHSNSVDSPSIPSKFL